LVFFSENLGLFRFVSEQFILVFRFYIETVSFDVSIEPKQTEVSIEPKQTEDQPKQFDREHILVFYRKFRVVSVNFETVLFVSVVSLWVRNTETNQNFLFFV
jgi:hypothetical protein